MITTPKSGGGRPVTECESSGGAAVAPSTSSSSSPLAGPGPGGHKASFKSNKLARRARSFKDDFLEKLNQMRSPSGGGVSPAQGQRSQSPSKGRVPAKGLIDQVDGDAAKGDAQRDEFELLSKQMQLTLTHMRGVIKTNKLEVLPGNGNIVLDIVFAINLVVRSALSTDPAGSIRSATQRMYLSVAKLIRLTDDVLLDSTLTSIKEESIKEVIEDVENSVKDLIKLARDKIKCQQHYKTTPRTSHANISLEMPSQRNSLPDIPLTPRERQILEDTSGSVVTVRNSHSSESILMDQTPPPKPPLPDSHLETSTNPPPLPPKRKICQLNMRIEDCIDGFERLSIRSRSPGDSSSVKSESAGSVDSMLNESREEEEISALDDHNLINDTFDTDLSDTGGSNDFYQNFDSGENTSISFSSTNELHAANHLEMKRLSNTDSGIVSMHSKRSSSCSKRSSQQSSVSTQWSTAQQQQQSVKSVETVLSESFQSNVFQKTTSSNSIISNHIGFVRLENEPELDGELLDVAPPAIPLKTKRKHDRQPSPYDNVPDCPLGGEVLVSCQMHQSHQSLSSSTSISSSMSQDNSKPPPLPPKKKHIMAYMEMFGNCSHANDQEFMRHSVHVHGASAASWSPGLPTTQSCSFTHHSSSSSHTSSNYRQTINTLHPSTDPSPISSPMKSPSHHHTPHLSLNVTGLPPALPPKRLRAPSAKSMSPPATPTLAVPATVITTMEIKQPTVTLPEPLPDLLKNTLKADEEMKAATAVENEGVDVDLMEELDARKYLVYNKPDDDGSDVRGGYIDALIIHATKTTRKAGLSYQEAFVTTYRTFIEPFDLICKLIKRYAFFHCQPEKKKASREAFALMVRVVTDLTPADLDNKMQQKLIDFIQELIINGDLTLAKALRIKHIERHEHKERCAVPPGDLQLRTTLKTRDTLLEFKSEQIAEQMTLLDAELFMKIEIPEVLIWAQEQNEERSPNLTRFTEHFNKMSYWARKKILKAEAKDREKYFLKFIKIMKHLRKMNNFNSYLALLSALDSAPIRRLEWQKHVQEGLKEYCALIDSSSSFRAYRQALSETNPPCIPYIGLVLQDLTFVHIGNSNLLPDNTINFSKRWQQYNIVENMKKFKCCSSSSEDNTKRYPFKRNERLLAYFDDFNDVMNEDEMWHISEQIKPRGYKKTTAQ